MKKSLLAILLAVGLICGSMTGCGGSTVAGNTQNDVNTSMESGAISGDADLLMYTVNDRGLNVRDDNYRTCYEVFVYSFWDSNSDGIGDLNGLIQKLDYINDGNDETDKDLGCNAIWLMPVMPSTTYHKYDVMDYYDIDPEYGTLDDFKRLVEECHARGINVIMDLVMNHTSSRHEWFRSACEYLDSLEPGQTPDEAVCPYVGYYNFTDKAQGNFHQVGDTEWFYEGQFWSEMPDLNLANKNVRQEFEDIARYWLELGVDGFRLDAVKEFYSGSTEKNIEVLSWFNDAVKSIKADTYLVGEVWEDYNGCSKYYESGLDSFFDFSFADSTGYISKVLNGNAKSGASTYGKAIEAVNDTILQYTDNYIDAPFYSNHDLARSAGYYSGEYAEEKVKMGHAMNLLMSGNAFIYYGEELGMKGSGRDENKRVGMYWSENTNMVGVCAGPVDADTVEMIYPSLEVQQEDPGSIYNYVKQAIKLRNIYPEIARGTMTFHQELSNDQVCVFTKEYEGSQLMIIFNLSENENAVDLSGISLNGKDAGNVEEAGMLQTSGAGVRIDGSRVIMPAYSVEIIK